MPQRAPRGPGPGRPPAEAPRGRLTLQEAAELAGVSYSLVYRRVEAGEVPSERDASGVITVAKRDLKLLGKRPKADTKTHAVMMRPVLEQHEAWEREAKRRGMAVSALAMQVMDEVSGWRG